MTKPRLALAVAALAGCASPDGSSGTSEQQLTCPVPVIDPSRSLAVTDSTALANFSFKRTMNAITSSVGATNTPRQIYNTWMGTFADCSNPNIDPFHYGIVCPRVESEFANFDPFESTGARFVPVALTNRFDLAPKSGADCGEYRIVYGLLNGPGRGFIIFEGRLPNPNVAAGLAGCTAVANFWAQLSNDSSATSRANKLQKFYYTGLKTDDGTVIGPVVTASAYGLATDGGPHSSGQIRTNFFASLAQWQLREFKLTKTGTTLSVDQVTVKTNPANELFASTNPKAPAFQTAFLKQVASLQSTDLATIGMTNADKFNEYESVSENAHDVVYRDWATSDFQTQIAGAITDPKLTVTNILDRATTQTCAGCHQISNGVALGESLVWPQSLGFVQIDENSKLSPALVNVFLPHRADVLTQFLEGQCNGQTAADDGRDIGGGALDSAN